MNFQKKLMMLKNNIDCMLLESEMSWGQKWSDVLNDIDETKNPKVKPYIMKKLDPVKTFSKIVNIH